MNWLHYQLALMPSPGAILHIGAGLCTELPDYQQIEPDRIILVEPNPETINALRQKAAEYDNVTLLQAAVAAEAGRAQLRRFNFPELDSLREPAGLYQLLPGLQQTGQTEVPTISPAQLTRRLSLEDSTNNWLVLEAPGEEAVILEELNRTGALQNFSRLIVRTGTEPFYEGDAWSAPLLEQLESFGYFVEATPDDNDPDWPRFHLKFQPLALKCRELEARVEEKASRNEQLKSERSALATELEEHRQKLDDLRAESTAKSEEIDNLSARLTDLTKEQEKLESARQKLSEQAEARTSELEQARAEWDKERQSLEAKKNEETEALNSRIAELEKEREELKSARQELSEHAKACASELEQAKAEWDKERQALEEKKTEEVNGLNSRIEALEKERDELQSARHELSVQAEASASELETANQQRTQLEQKLEEKSAEAEKLKKSAAELKTAKEQYEKLATEQSRQLEERQKQHTELDERQRLLDTEVQRAEAQIDLIKDVLIREKNF